MLDLRSRSSWWWRMAALLLVAGVSGCGLLYPDRWDERRDVMEHYRAIWIEHGIQSYHFVHTEFGESARAAAGPVHVTVVDGAIVEVEPLTETDVTPDPTWYYTIDDLFDVIADAIGRKPNHFQTGYDPVLGHPTILDMAGGGLPHGGIALWVEDFVIVEEEAAATAW